MSNVDSFISRFYSIAKQIEVAFKIPTLVSLAQAAIESNFGTKAPGNNLFGIKASSSWTGKTVDFVTTEIVTPEQFKKLTSVKTSQLLNSGNYKVTLVQKFRAYNSPADSFTDYARLISTATRYKNAFKEADPYRFATEIARAGYATAPAYAASLHNFIDVIKKKFLALPQAA